MAPTQFKIRMSDQGMTLIAYLAAHLQLSNHKAKALLDARRVFVNGQRIWMARHRLEIGDRLEIQGEAVYAPAVTREAVLYESKDYLIANKPPGLLANGPQSLEVGLRRLLNNPALKAVHRLDRDTSGCLLFALQTGAETRIRSLFMQHRIRKVYHAIVIGFVQEKEREITYPIEHQAARTILKTLDANTRASHLRLEIETGRTHQIRRHLVAIGHPLLGDRQYATRREVSPQERAVRRQMLHASELLFRHPVTGLPIHARADLPDDFIACLRRFGLT